MKKIIVISLALCLMLGVGFGFAATFKYTASPASDNVINENGPGGASGTTRPTHVIKVRYAAQGAIVPGLNSGDAVIWDSVSADGYTVKLTSTASDEQFAGILVTPINTADVGDTSTTSQYNTGWMAIEGFCLASIDAAIIPTAGNAGLAIGASGALTSNNDGASSQDAAILLETSSASSNSTTRNKVWLLGR